MRRRMARANKQVDPREFRGADEESDDEDKCSAKRKRRNLGNAAPHSVRSHAGGSSSSLSSSDNEQEDVAAKIPVSTLSRARMRTTDNRIAQLSVSLCLSARLTFCFSLSLCTLRTLSYSAQRARARALRKRENFDICASHKHNEHVSYISSSLPLVN